MVTSQVMGGSALLPKKVEFLIAVSVYVPGSKLMIVAVGQELLAVTIASESSFWVTVVRLIVFALGSSKPCSGEVKPGSTTPSGTPVGVDVSRGITGVTRSTGVGDSKGLAVAASISTVGVRVASIVAVSIEVVVAVSVAVTLGVSVNVAVDVAVSVAAAVALGVGVSEGSSVGRSVGSRGSGVASCAVRGRG
jgi:hypothetical protein